MTYVINPVAVSASPLAMDGRRTRHLKQYKPSAHLIPCLVVDDDLMILKYVASMLAMLGFQKVEIAQVGTILANNDIAIAAVALSQRP